MYPSLYRFQQASQYMKVATNIHLNQNLGNNYLKAFILLMNAFIS